MPGETDGTLPNRPRTALHKDDAPIHGSGCMYGTMSGDARNA